MLSLSRLAAIVPVFPPQPEEAARPSLFGAAASQEAEDNQVNPWEGSWCLSGALILPGCSVSHQSAWLVLLCN